MQAFRTHGSPAVSVAGEPCHLVRGRRSASVRSRVDLDRVHDRLEFGAVLIGAVRVVPGDHHQAVAIDVDHVDTSVLPAGLQHRPASKSGPGPGQ